MRSRSVIRITSLIIIIVLAVVSVIGLKPYDFFMRTACLSVTTVIPDGTLTDMYKNDISRPTDVTVDITSADKYTTADKASANVISGRPVSEAIEKTVIGNVIQRTVSPYSAKVSFGNVYINNKCGETVDIEAEISEPLGFSVEKGSEPQILIYHTHATESYMLEDKSAYTEEDNTRTTDNTKNVIAVGDKIAEQLEAAGYTVIHDTTLHDYPGYTGSYTRSAKTVNAILEQYPSIKIAIDVHRDSIASGDSDKVAPVVSVDGKEAAQVMLVMGSQTGSITGHPNWRQNLRLAMKLQYVFETTYPQFARPILLKSAKYNQHLTSGSILVEMGSDANTLEQALYSGELVGRSLVTLLDSQSQ